MAPRVFLLSPASCTGKRAGQLLDPQAEFELARRVRGGGATLGEVFSFCSALYFRGKLSYAQRFAAPSRVFVITPSRGLVSPELAAGRELLREFASVPIDAAEPRYASALRDSVLALRERLPRRAEVVLLGSIATAKYVDVLLPVFAKSLLFPADFVGRGDMSRGGLLLRAARAGRELEYLPIDGAERRGARPARPDPASTS
ncbi:MAG TPA: hypothetical protein VEI82_11255 [Myxococcota bacterium]|nr:hypothetical protein [Myxococcota bacterium]